MGDSGPQLAGLLKLFYNPEMFDILPYKNSFNKKNEVVYTGFFIPAFDTIIDHMDHRGVCNRQAAMDEENAKRMKMHNSPDDLMKYCSEYCFYPEEAFIREGSNRFDMEKLSEQMTNIELHKLYKPPVKGDLKWPFNKEKGKVDFTKIPEFEVSNSGKINIVEYPFRDLNGVAYNNLYVAGIDSIDADQSTSSGLTDVSDFCIVIYKRIFGMQEPKIVAIYKDRPKDISTAYNNAIKLCLWYNCKAVVESSRVGIITYFKQKNMLYYLAKRPKATISNAVASSNAIIKQYGVIPSVLNITHANELIENFVYYYAHTIEFKEVIDELMRYSFENKRKFDIVASLGMALLGDEDMYGIEPVTSIKKSDWKDIGYYYDEYGYKKFGVIPK